MNPYYVIILLIGSRTLYTKVKALTESAKAGNREKMSVDIFFLLITLALIALLIALKDPA